MELNVHQPNAYACEIRLETSKNIVKLDTNLDGFLVLSLNYWSFGFNGTVRLRERQKLET
jgi:hypothetical protein